MRRYASGRNMSQRVAPVIQVPDARAMTGRYVSISFKLIGKSEKDANSKGEADAGREPSDVRFGWKPSAAERRDAALYRLAREARDFCGRRKEPVPVAQDVCERSFGTGEFSLRAIHGISVMDGRPMQTERPIGEGRKRASAS